MARGGLGRDILPRDQRGAGFQRLRRRLDLLRPIYAKTAAYGHFGREEPEFTWEATDKIALLREAAGLKGEAKTRPILATAD